MFIHSAIENATPQTVNQAFSYLIPLACLRLPSSVVGAVNLGRDNELLLSATVAAFRLISSLQCCDPSGPPSTLENLGTFCSSRTLRSVEQLCIPAA